MLETTYRKVLTCLALGLGVSTFGVADATAQDTQETRTEETQRDLEVVKGEILVTATIPELATEQVFPGTRVRDSSGEDLVEFFRQTAGGSAVRRSAINLEPTVRGLQEDQVATFVDGTRTFAAGPARMDSNLSHVSPQATQSLRVVKGPYALTWGAGSLSAISVETRRPSFSPDGWDWQGNLGGSYGENGDVADAHGGVWGGNDRFRLYLGVGRREGGDYEDGDGNLVPGDYTSDDSRWRFGFRPNDQWLLEYSGGYQEQRDIDYPGRLLDATYFYTRSAALELTWSGAGAGSRAGTVSQVYGQVYANRKDHRMNNDEKPTGRDMPGRIPPFALDVDLPTESNTSGARFRVDGQDDRFSWSLGADYYDVEQTAERTVARRSNGFVIFRDIVWPDAEIQDLGGYGQVVWGGERHRWGATVRLDSVDASASTLSDFFRANTVGDPDQSETHVSAALSGSFNVGDHGELTVGVGRAVRTATVLERYSDRFPATKFQLAAEFMGNPELDPEESLELDLGYRTSQGGFDFEINAFYRQIDDYITVVADPTLSRRLPLSPPTVYRYINGEEATFYGGELRIGHRVNTSLAWRGSLSYVRAEDESFDEPVLGIAPLQGHAGLRYTFRGEGAWIDFGIRFADRQDRVATVRFEQETPGWVAYDLTALWRVSEQVGLRLGVENLTDHAYAEHLNAPNPFTGMRILETGRQVRAGVEWTF